MTWTQLLPSVVFLNVLLLTWVTIEVGRARGRHGVRPPATTGPEGFERAFRAQMNTIEQSVIFMPIYWLASQYFRADVVFGLGLLWIVGRVWFVLGYLHASEKRAPGFVIGLIASNSLLLCAVLGYVRGLMS
jgi:glutathione S-transferase